MKLQNIGKKLQKSIMLQPVLLQEIKVLYNMLQNYWKKFFCTKFIACY